MHAGSPKVARNLSNFKLLKSHINTKVLCQYIILELNTQVALTGIAICFAFVDYLIL